MTRKIRIVLTVVAMVILSLVFSASASAAKDISLDPVTISENVLTAYGSINIPMFENSLYVAVYAESGHMLNVKSAVPDILGDFSVAFSGLSANRSYTIKAFCLNTATNIYVEDYSMGYVGKAGVLNSCHVDDLVIAEEVGNGTVTLNGAAISGTMYVYGGGPSSVILNNTSSVGNVVLSKTASGSLRLYTEEGARVSSVEIDDGKDEVILEGFFNQVAVKDSVPVIVKNAHILDLSIEAPSADVAIVSDAGCEIESCTIDDLSYSSKLNIGASVEIHSLDSYAPNAAITGDEPSSLVTAYVHGYGTTVDIPNMNSASIIADVYGVTFNNEPVSVHTHDFQQMFDSDKHWQGCINCGYSTDFCDHSCDEWTADESGHRHVCADCDSEYDTGDHDEGQWAGDDVNHWMECTVCGYHLTEPTGHTWNVEQPTVDTAKYCTVCGYVLEGQAAVDVTSETELRDAVSGGKVARIAANFTITQDLHLTKLLLIDSDEYTLTIGSGVRVTCSVIGRIVVINGRLVNNGDIALNGSECRISIVGGVVENCNSSLISCRASSEIIIADEEGSALINNGTVLIGSGTADGSPCHIGIAPSSRLVNNGVMAIQGYLNCSGTLENNGYLSIYGDGFVDILDNGSIISSNTGILCCSGTLNVQQGVLAMNSGSELYVNANGVITVNDQLLGNGFKLTNMGRININGRSVMDGSPAVSLYPGSTMCVSGELIYNCDNTSSGKLTVYGESDNKPAARLTAENGGYIRLGDFDKNNNRLTCADGSIVNCGVIDASRGNLEVVKDDDKPESDIVTGTPIIYGITVTTQRELINAVNSAFVQNIFISGDLTLDPDGAGVKTDGDDRFIDLIKHPSINNERRIYINEGSSLTVPNGLTLNISLDVVMVFDGTLYNNGGIDCKGGLDRMEWGLNYIEGDGSWLNTYPDAISFAQNLAERFGTSLKDQWKCDESMDGQEWPTWDDRFEAYRFLVGSCGESAETVSGGETYKQWRPYRKLTIGETKAALEALWETLGQDTSPSWLSCVILPTEVFSPVDGVDNSWLISDETLNRVLDNYFSYVTLPRTTDSTTTEVVATGNPGDTRAPHFYNTIFNNKITVTLTGDEAQLELYDDSIAYAEAFFTNCQFDGGLEIALDDGRFDTDYNVELHVDLDKCTKITGGITVVPADGAQLDDYNIKDHVQLSFLPAGQAVSATAPVCFHGCYSLVLNDAVITAAAGEDVQGDLRLQCMADHNDDGIDYGDYNHNQCTQLGSKVARLYVSGNVADVDLNGGAYPTYNGAKILNISFDSKCNATLELGSLSLAEDERLWLSSRSEWEDKNDNTSGGGFRVDVTGTVSGGTVEISEGTVDVQNLNFSASRLDIGVWNPTSIHLGTGTAYIIGGFNTDGGMVPVIDAADGAEIYTCDQAQMVEVIQGSSGYSAYAPHLFGDNYDAIFLGYGKDDIDVKIYKDGSELTGFATERIDTDGDKLPDKTHFIKGDAAEWFDGSNKVTLEVTWMGVKITYQDIWHKMREVVTAASEQELIDALNNDCNVYLESSITLTQDLNLRNDVYLTDNANITITVPKGKHLNVNGNLHMGMGSKLYSSGTVAVSGFIEGQDATIDNHGWFVNNGQIRLLGASTLRHSDHDGTLPFENSGCIELYGGVFDLSGAADSSFKNTRYMKIVDIYSDGGGDGSENQVCAVNAGDGFSKLSEDSNWLDYTAMVYSEAGYDAAQEAQSEKITALGDNYDDVGLAIYNRMDFASAMAVTKDMTLDGFRDYWIQEQDNGKVTLTVNSGTQLTVAQGNTLHVNGGCELKLESGSALAIDDFQEDISGGILDLWPESVLTGSGSISTVSGQIEVRFEWDEEHNCFSHFAQLPASLPGSIFNIAHIHDEAELREANDDDFFSLLHIRQGGKDPDGNHIALTVSIDIGKDVQIDSNSGLIVNEGVHLNLGTTQSDNNCLNNHGDISVFGTLFVGQGYCLNNHYFIKTSGSDITHIALLQSNGRLDNYGEIRLHSYAQFGISGGEFHGQDPIYDGSGDDKLMANLSSAQLTDTHSYFDNIRFDNKVMIMDYEDAQNDFGSVTFRNCDFTDGIEIVTAADRKFDVEFLEGCTMNGKPITIVAGEGTDATNPSSPVDIHGCISGFNINVDNPNMGVNVKTAVGGSEVTYNAIAPHIFGEGDSAAIFLGWANSSDVTAKLTINGTEITGFSMEAFDSENDEDTLPDKIHITKGTATTWITDKSTDNVKLEITWNGVTIIYEHVHHVDW